MTSCSSCERESDNKYEACPAKMADGRAFTDYKPRCAVHSSLMESGHASGKALNSYELRQFLINNAENIMEKSRTQAQTQNNCGPCVQPWNKGTMLPEQSMVKCNTSTCSVSTNDPNGLGRGRDYGIAPDAAFVGKMEQRNAQMGPNVCTGYDEDIKYYPLAPVAEERFAVPSGGSPFTQN